MGHAVVASTESKERTKIGSNRKPERKVKIHVEQVLNPDDDLVKTEATEGAALTNAPKKLNREKSDSVPSPTNINDPETWVSRIMHPWLDSQFCCPGDDWDASKTRHKSTGSLFDQSTIATNNSFESTPSHLNETSSVTPMLPPFPTSSKLGSDDSTTDNFVTADEVNCNQQQTRQVLGIQNPHIDEDDGLVLEEITSQHQSSTPHPSLQEERYDSFSSGNGNISAWRRKSWVEVDVKRRHEDTMKEFEKNVFDEEFDVESYTSDYNGILGTGDGNFTSRWPLYEI